MVYNFCFYCTKSGSVSEGLPNRRSEAKDVWLMLVGSAYMMFSWWDSVRFRGIVMTSSARWISAGRARARAACGCGDGRGWSGILIFLCHGLLLLE